MEKINDKLLAIVSFVIFFINIIKYYLINIEQIIRPYSPTNRLVSYIMLPIIFIGIVLSFIVLFKNIFYEKKSLINILLSLPLIWFVIYFFFIK